MAIESRWLVKVVGAFISALSIGRQNRFPHEFSAVYHGKVEIRRDSGQTFGSYLTDTVAYHH